MNAGGDVAESGRKRGGSVRLGGGVTGQVPRGRPTGAWGFSLALPFRLLLREVRTSGYETLPAWEGKAQVCPALITVFFPVGKMYPVTKTF